MRSTAAFCSTVYLRSWLPWLCSRRLRAEASFWDAEAPEAAASGMVAREVGLGRGRDVARADRERAPERRLAREATGVEGSAAGDMGLAPYCPSLGSIVSQMRVVASSVSSRGPLTVTAACQVACTWPTQPKSRISSAVRAGIKGQIVSATARISKIGWRWLSRFSFFAQVCEQ